MKQTICYLLALLSMVGCGGGGSSTTTTTNYADQPNLRDVSPVPLGVALGVGDFETKSSIRYSANAENYQALAAKEFNSVVAENVMKPEFIHPQENEYFWDDADYLVDFAKANNMQVHGHTLIWYQTLPNWMQNYSGDWEQMMIDHITTIVSHYSDSISSWDVLNEAFQDDGTERTSIWQQHIPDYIAKAFSAARTADPDADLYYNDYNLASAPAKLNAVLEMASDFKTRNIPIDGIGFQMHIDSNSPNLSQLRTAFSKAVATGLKIRISEMDVVMNPDGAYTGYASNIATQEHDRFKQVVALYLELVPLAQRGGITFWGLADNLSWIPNYYKHADWPLLFDSKLQRKAAWTGVYEALTEN